MKTTRGWILVGVLAGGFGVITFREAIAVSALRTQVEVRQLDVQALDQMRRENARLAASPVASPQADETEIARARAELSDLQRRAGHTAEVSAVESGRFAAGTKIAASEWRNVGNATPQATLETALWAAAGGDLDAFAANLLLSDAGARNAAQALFNRLPEPERERYRTPERLIAALTIPDVPTGAVEVRAWSEPDSNRPTRFVAATFSAADGASKKVTLMFVDREDGWKLGLTRSAVAKYAAQLTRGEPTAR